MSGRVFEQSVVMPSAASAARDLIREAIIDGRLAPGQRLKEGDLAEELAISRTPIREALRLLENEGLVESRPRRGARVHTYSIHDIAERYELRSVLEGYAARRAASRISEHDLRSLEESCERFEQLRSKDDILERVEENLYFHTLILNTGGHEQLTRIAHKMIDLPLVYKMFFWSSPEQKHSSDEAHRMITAALKRADGDAAEAAMRQHLLIGMQHLASQLAEHGLH